MSDINQKKSFYDYSATDYQNNTIKMSEFKGKVVIVCNIASECGLASKNYKNMQEIRSKFGKDVLEILLFPCNQFLNQEPNEYSEIKNKIETYFSDYHLFSKVNVKGKDEHELFTFLKKEKKNFWNNFFIWNFTKFIIDKEGNVVERYYSTSTVDEKLIEDLLKK